MPPPGPISGPSKTYVDAGDAATLATAEAYTDSQIQNFDIKDPVAAATTGALPFSPTYSNGSSGVGATLSGTVGVLAFDGYTPALNDRVLVKNQASAFQNGIYKVTTVGTIVVGYVLTRATDFNQTANILYGDTVAVLQGTVNANQQFTMNNNNAITVGTTAITFAQTSGGSQLIAGTGISIVGNTISNTAAISKSILSVSGLGTTSGSFDAFPPPFFTAPGDSPGIYFLLTGGFQPDETLVGFVMPYNATLKRLFVKNDQAGGSGSATVTYTVRKNGVDTALTVTQNTTASNLASDTTHNVSVFSGEVITISVVTNVPALASTSGFCSITIEADAA